MKKISKSEALTRRLFGYLAPPEEILLSAWTEANIVLPVEQQARPGRMKNWPYMVQILDAIGDMQTERVTIMKSARLGFSKGLVFAGAAVACTDPSPIIYLLPTDEDAKGFSVDDLEPIFEASPVLAGMMKKSQKAGQNTLVRKQLLGGTSIKILSARAPRKLRRHDAKYLFVDEADGMEVTTEGDALAIAERRTMAHADRKIVVGSTPTEEGISVVERRYNLSTQEIYMCPCPECGAFHEIIWDDIRYENNDPATTRWVCPSCKKHVHERMKSWMVNRGRFVATKPEVKGHRGFRISALASLLPNTAWSTLVAEWIEAVRGGPSTMQPFVNTVLGRTWRTSINRVDSSILASRVEPIGMSSRSRTAMSIPRDCLLITCGADVQDDRIEAVLIGWRLRGGPYILGHVVFEGNTLEDLAWKSFDEWLKLSWKHPNGWRIGIDGTAVDSGGREGRTQKVYDWTYPRHGRRIYAIKGEDGPKRVWAPMKKVKGNMKGYIVAVDVVKTEVLERLGRAPLDEDGNEDPTAFRYSDSLDDEFFTQATNEVRRIKYRRMRPYIIFQPKTAGARTEALDCLVYATAVRQANAVRLIDLRERAARVVTETAQQAAKPKGAAGWAAAFNQA